MKYFIILALMAMTDARIITNQDDCDGVLGREILYEKEILKKGIDKPFQMAIDYDNKMLFFSYSIRAETDEYSKSAYINLKNNEFSNIEGIFEGFASTVDTTCQSVYLGGKEGIYKYNYNTTTARYIAAKEHNIWQMFFKNKLYYTTYPDEKVYSYKEGEYTEVPELENTTAKLVAVDKKDNLFFVNSSGLFCYMQEKDMFVTLGDYVVNGFAPDAEGNLYFSTFSTGIYFINSGNDTLNVDKVVSLENVYGLAIEENGNIIYAKDDEVVRLKRNKNNLCVVGLDKNNNVPKI